MSNFAALVEFVVALTEASEKVDGFDYSVEEITQGLKSAGITLHISAFYRQLSNLKVHQNERGYYSAPDIAVLLAWNLKGAGRFSSCAKFLEVEGEKIRAEVARSRNTYVTL